MRVVHRIAGLVSSGLLAVVACSAAPVDGAGSSDEALILNPRPLPSECVLDMPTSTTPYEFVAAWATAPFANGCPVISGANGFWAQLGSVSPPQNIDQLIAPARYNGVPAMFETHATVPNCRLVTGMPANCCTYVWWPSGWASNPVESNPAPQDNGALCRIGGTFEAITYAPPCWWDCSRGACAALCNLPGGGGCSSCTHFPAPGP